jgi:hypothetical protein
MKTENVVLRIVVADSSKSFWSIAEVRLEVQTPKLNEYDPTSTCKKLQYSRNNHSRLLVLQDVNEINVSLFHVL